MKHLPSHVVVYQTADYSRFNMIDGNRSLNMTKISKIIKDIASGNDMLEDYPIQVIENGNALDILDGQHRFFISKKLNRSVFYILNKKQKTMANIATVNSNVEKWKPSDFINCYITNGNEHYKVLQKFIDTYKLDTGTSVTLLLTGTPNASGAARQVREIFEGGTFEAKHLAEASQIAEDAKLFEQSAFVRDRTFITAIYKIKAAGLVKLPDLVAAYMKRPEALKKQATQRDYIFNLEEIYSTGKHKRIQLT